MSSSSRRPRPSSMGVGRSQMSLKFGCEILYPKRLLEHPYLFRAKCPLEARGHRHVLGGVGDAGVAPKLL
jgi:hypothetical protein